MSENERFRDFDEFSIFLFFKHIFNINYDVMKGEL